MYPILRSVGVFSGPVFLWGQGGSTLLENSPSVVDIIIIIYTLGSKHPEG